MRGGEPMIPHVTTLNWLKVINVFLKRYSGCRVEPRLEGTVVEEWAQTSWNSGVWTRTFIMRGGAHLEEGRQACRKSISPAGQRVRILKARGEGVLCDPSVVMKSQPQAFWHHLRILFVPGGCDYSVCSCKLVNHGLVILYVSSRRQFIICLGPTWWARNFSSQLTLPVSSIFKSAWDQLVKATGHYLNSLGS